jgi:Na+/H+ antiporter NhaC
MSSGVLRLAAAAAAILLLWWIFPAPDHVVGTAWSLLPPLVAIGLALTLRQVVASLVLGVFVGAMLMVGSPGTAFLRVVDTHIRDALADADHVSIILFSMLLGAMVGVMSRAGGTAGVVQALAPLATSARRSQIATWFMGLAIFFDDYSNTLVVGNAMRPVTDRFRVSREKLAFLVDSTAAPVACVALVSTWVGYLVSVLGDALAASGAEVNAFTLFLRSIPAAFYPFAALTLTLSIAASRRDFGPMLTAERRAMTGDLLAPGAQPLADYESAGLEPDPDTPNRWANAALPVATVVVVTLAGLWSTGRTAMIAAGVSQPDLRQIVGASDPFSVLLWGSFAGLAAAIVLTVGQRILTLGQAFEAVLTGFRSMLIAMVVLTLAWALGGVCDQLDTAEWITARIGDQLPPAALPTMVFLVAAAVAFSTGTSWGNHRHPGAPGHSPGAGHRRPARRPAHRHGVGDPRRRRVRRPLLTDLGHHDHVVHGHQLRSCGPRPHPVALCRNRCRRLSGVGIRAGWTPPSRPLALPSGRGPGHGRGALGSRPARGKDIEILRSGRLWDILPVSAALRATLPVRVEQGP